MESDQLLLTIFTGLCPSYWRSDMSSLRLPDTSDPLKFGVLCTASTDCELFGACHIDAGFPGEMTFNHYDVTTASFAFEIRTFLLRMLH